MGPGDLHFIPDQELAIAAKGQSTSGVPSYLALSELQRRNQVRATAAQPPPPGTVADDVIGKAIRSSGIMSAAPQQQQPQQQPQQQSGQTGLGSVMPAQHMASGGQVQPGQGASYDSVLGSMGMLPHLQSIDPSQYQNQYVAPVHESLQDANAAIAPTFGKAPDYGSTLAEINQMKKSIKPYGLGEWMSNLGSGIMSGGGPGGGNATDGVGRALANANGMERAVNQQNLQNEEKLTGMSNSVQNQQSDRQAKIAESSARYQEINNQMADNEANRKQAVQNGNTASALKIAQENNALAAEQSKIRENGMTLLSNPAFASVAKEDALRRGDTAAAGFLGDVQSGYFDVKKKASDIDKDREMSVQGARAAASMSEMEAREALSHRYKMEEQENLFNAPPPAVTKDSSGSTLVNGKQIPALFKDIAHYRQSDSLLTRLNGPQKIEAQQFIDAENPNYNKQYFDQISGLRKSATSGAYAANVNAGNAAIMHMDLLSKAADALGNGDNNTLNSISQRWAKEMGKAAPTNFNGLKEQIAGELVAALKKNGIADEHTLTAVKEGMQNVNSPSQIKGFLAGQTQVLGGKMAENRANAARTPGLEANDPVLDQLSFTPDARRVMYHNGFDPENIQAGQTLQGLPGGFGKLLDHKNPETAKIGKQFLDAAGGDANKARRFATDFGWKLQ